MGGEALQHLSNGETQRLGSPDSRGVGGEDVTQKENESPVSNQHAGYPSRTKGSRIQSGNAELLVSQTDIGLLAQSGDAQPDSADVERGGSGESARARRAAFRYRWRARV